MSTKKATKAAKKAEVKKVKATNKTDAFQPPIKQYAKSGVTFLGVDVPAPNDALRILTTYERKTKQAVRQPQGKHAVIVGKGKQARKISLLNAALIFCGVPARRPSKRGGNVGALVGTYHTLQIKTALKKAGYKLELGDSTIPNFTK